MPAKTLDQYRVDIQQAADARDGQRIADLLEAVNAEHGDDAFRDLSDEIIRIQLGLPARGLNDPHIDI